MKRQLIKYLYSFKDRQYHEINGFLKENCGDYDLHDIRSELFKMTEKGIIEMERDRLRKFGSHTGIPDIHPINNVLADLNTWTLKARLSIDQKDKLDEEADKETTKQLSSIYIGGDAVGSVIGQTSGESSLEAINNPKIKDSPQSKPATRAMSKLFVKIAVGVIITVIGGLIIWYLTK